MDTITLKITCDDKKGLVAKVTSFIYENSGNIVNLDQYTDLEKKKFFMRIEWDSKGFNISKKNLRDRVQHFLDENNICSEWEMFFSEIKPKMAIFVSKYDHCLYDLLLRYKSGEHNVEIPVIISNHKDLENVAKNFKIDFHYIPVNKDNKDTVEKKQLEILSKKKIDFIVLARYMQVLTKRILSAYPNKIINIHHSFLPAFKGAKPYHQAYDRGVKIIGATSHFVTEVLDQGPIIKQDITYVTHKHRVKDLVIKGRDIERRVLSEAVRLFTKNRIFICDNKTIIL